MNKGKILSKFVAKDYETKLEEILEDKDFSEDVKNLLLSCVYKIEAGYKDYEQVKQIVQKKEEYLENILNIVKDKCNEIEIIKNNKNIKRKYEVDKFKGKIKLWHPNEKSLLYAIYELDDSPIYVDEKYRFVRVALTELINEGENINNLEVLRDFNGWNWNTLSSEIPNISVNLIYQNLVYLLGIDFLKTWLHAEEIKDYFAIAKDILKEKYGTQNANEFIEHMNNISIITCVEHNEKEKLRLQEEKEEILKE